MRTIAVIGFSLAGLRAAETLRREGFEGRLLAIGEEPQLPYDRPPLSKELLRGEWGPEKTALRRKGYEDLALDLRLGRRAVALDARTRRIELDDGETVRCDGIVIASGAHARPLRGQPRLEGLHLLRTLDDSLAIGRALEKNPRVVVVGGGFIGMEVAASCRARKLDVSVVEPLEAPLVRGLGREMGEVAAALHRDHGVDLRLEIGVERIEGAGRVERVRLRDGRTLDADLVVVGVGAVPATGWLEGSGLTLDDGVVCDETCAASEGIVAAGDVARWLHHGRLTRIEHWTHAVEQGMYAATRLLKGRENLPAFTSVPLVWSDQYDVKIQVAGRIEPEDRHQVVWGSIEQRKFTALFGREERLSAVLTFSRPRDCMLYRGLIEQGISWDAALERARQAS